MLNSALVKAVSLSFLSLQRELPANLRGVLSEHHKDLSLLILGLNTILRNPSVWEDNWIPTLNTLIGAASIDLKILRDTVKARKPRSVKLDKAQGEYEQAFRQLVLGGSAQVAESMSGPPVIPPDITVYTDKFVDMITGQVYDVSTDPPGYRKGWREPILSYLFGADRWSSTSKNGQPLIQHRPMVGERAAVMPGTYENFRMTRTYDVDPLIADPSHWDGTRIIYGLKNSTKIQPNEITWGLDPQFLLYSADPDNKAIIAGGRTYLEWMGAITLKDLILRGPVEHTNSAITQTENPKMEQGEWQGHRDIEIINCEVDGQFTFYNAKNAIGHEENRWGHQNFSAGRSSRGTYGFICDGGSVHGIDDEHAFYFHCILGTLPDGTLDDGAPAVLLKGLNIKHCGRTAVQVVCRWNEQDETTGRGHILLQDLNVEDVCLESGGGGSAFTMAGNHRGIYEINGCTVKLGCDPNLHPDYQANITGAVVVWEGGGSSGVTCKEVVIKNSHFEVGQYFPGEDSARRTNVNVAFCDKFTMMNTTIKQWPGASDALRIGDDVPEVFLERSCVVIGDIKMDGITYHDHDYNGQAWTEFLFAIDSVVPSVHPRVTLIG